MQRVAMSDMPVGRERPEVSRKVGRVISWMKSHGLSYEEEDAILEEIGKDVPFEGLPDWIRVKVMQAEEQMRESGE